MTKNKTGRVQKVKRINNKVGLNIGIEITMHRQICRFETKPF